MLGGGERSWDLSAIFSLGRVDKTIRVYPLSERPEAEKRQTTGTRQRNSLATKPCAGIWYLV